MKIDRGIATLQKLAAAQERVNAFTSKLGAMVAPAFAESGLHEYISSPAEAEVAFKALVGLLKERGGPEAFKREVNKRLSGSARKPGRRTKEVATES